MPHFSKLPADTVLEILRSLSFHDGLALSMVSPLINHIASTRSYWHTLITVNRLTEGPLSIPLDDDLTSYDAAQLKNIVLRKLRLEANWARAESQCVRLMRPVTSFCCKPVADNYFLRSTLLFHVSGTQLVVTMGAGMFTCWDVLSGQPVTQVSSVFQKAYATLLAPPHYEPGRCTVVARCADSSDTDHAVVVRLNYGHSPICLTVSIYQALPHDFTEHYGWVFNGDILAHVIWDDAIYIQAVNIHDRRTSNIRTNIPLNVHVSSPDSIEVKLIFWKGDLFIWHAAFDTTLQIDIHRCPANLLPSSNNSACPLVTDIECYNPSLSYMITDEDWTSLASLVQPPAPYLNTMELEQLHFCSMSGRLTGVFYAEVGGFNSEFLADGFILVSWDFLNFTDSESLVYNAKPLSVTCDTSPAIKTESCATPQAFSPFGSLLLARAPPLSKPELYVRRATLDGSSTKFLQLEKPADLEVRDTQITLDDGLGMVVIMDREAEEISVLQYA